MLEFTTTPSSESITVLADTLDYIVVNKPPGITIQRDIEGDLPGLLELTAQQCGVAKLLPVHRLDKLTSGIVVMAKHSEANRLLAEQFAARQVEKFYLAISIRKPRKKQGLISGDMERSRRRSWKLLSRQENPAQTQFFSASIGPGKRLFLLRPRTGKTHQLRVALKSIGAPILGDDLYGADSADRGYLHAYVLRFRWQEQWLTFKALPEQGSLFQEEGFLEAMVAYEEPWGLGWPHI
jgi:tRNA pseudouridine32 synthase / 23S rRNA pseudouridine746 synthase